MIYKGVRVEDTFCEAFDGLYCRVLITAEDEKRLKRAAYDSTALPCCVFGESEGGIEKFVRKTETPDGRPGAIVQYWVSKGEGDVKGLEYEVSKRIRQGVLVVPTTLVFNLLDSAKKLDTLHAIGHCGDGYESVEGYLGREMINIPVMMGSFRIEKNLGYSEGIMGGNLWFYCNSEKTALKVLDKAEEAVKKVEGVVLSFREGCSAGSKAGGKYEHIGPTTNHPYCPTLRERLKDSKVPGDVESIPEIVINGISLDSVKEAMKAAAEASTKVAGLIAISAGNFGGKLGKHRIFLRELLDYKP
ncbi:MAG: formylmethanofuran--tetrahydromethanopterin N-formyltransferase [Candidatus Altiarchaeota archaeon]